MRDDLIPGSAWCGWGRWGALARRSHLRSSTRDRVRLGVIGTARPAGRVPAAVGCVTIEFDDN